jgi:hypothetical protein
MGIQQIFICEHNIKIDEVYAKEFFKYKGLDVKYVINVTDEIYEEYKNFVIEQRDKKIDEILNDKK